jgi:hypothetical protein
MKRLMLVSLMLASSLVGCGGREDEPAPMLPDSGAPTMPPGSMPDGGGDAGPSIPLSTWLRAMVDEGGDDGNGMPDTVEDKIGVVKDTDDPSAFDEFVMPAP